MERLKQNGGFSKSQEVFVDLEESKYQNLEPR
jgi:hypothetical protein